jgi:hypothetical protein
MTLIESAIDLFASDSGEETFVVTARHPKTGETVDFTFRRLKSYDDVVRLNREAADFAKKMLGSASRALPPAWQEVLPTEVESAVTAFTVHALAVTPEVGQLDALKLAKKAPWLLSHLMSGIEANRLSYIRSEIDEVEAEKKDSSPTGGTEPS